MPPSYKNGTAEYTIHRIVAKLKLNFSTRNLVRFQSIVPPVSILVERILFSFSLAFILYQKTEFMSMKKPLLKVAAFAFILGLPRRLFLPITIRALANRKNF